MSEFQPFMMERMMSMFEQDVEYNLSESGVHPMYLHELLALRNTSLDDLMNVHLNYPHVNGIPELRENIAAIYSGAGPENVLVTIGAIEANYLTVRTLMSPGDEIVVMLPNYMQVWGIAKNHGLNIKTFNLREENGWAPDIDQLNDTVTDKTRLIAVCNPNNPTGYIMTPDEMDAIVAAADRSGAWILADEVYAGAERLTDQVTPSFFGRYDKVVAMGSMSKAYGLPGLRVGWAVAPPEFIDKMWARHEYVAISATMLSNQLASIALSPDVRPQILDRTRNYIRKGYPALEQWMNDHPGLFSLNPPGAAAIAFIRYHLDINSTEFIERLRTEKSLLIVPGDHFGLDNFVRISFGLPHDYLNGALDRMHELIEEIRG